LVLPAVTGPPPVNELLARIIHERLLQSRMPDSSEAGGMGGMGKDVLSSEFWVLS
jgi:hypothetical protein